MRKIFILKSEYESDIKILILLLTPTMMVRNLID